eukprot:CAMPEP_0174253904 /NCGR_PEP_ID=MMETSP0439-20130205/3271_1 /TAXON_ID=0 /ORGANISM="Stereomyxa ramosa, Strain Chinc5" /LENGTH=99 /DNA_ID=CAMNT_0015335207 /DNA_START=190 /DNA_END=490 /DNA_ORIENTATION=-
MNVIIDRCNTSKGDRKMWLNEARREGVTVTECIFLDIEVDECKRRAQNRRNHPTLSSDKAAEVIDSFGGGLSSPTEYEGFQKVTIITDQEHNLELKSED